MNPLVLSRHLFLALIGLFIFSCQGCDDDDMPCNDPSNMACPNYDPCHNRKMPVSAAFEVRPSNYDGSIIHISGDTVLAGSLIRFVALDSTSGTTYRWQVGNPQNTSSSISYQLGFDCDLVMDQTIPVQLIAERPADSTCLAEADRRDTVIRNIHFVSQRKCLFWGRWEGAIEGRPDEVFTVEVGFTEPFGGDCGHWDTVFVKNIRNDGTCLRRLLGGILFYKEAWFKETTSALAADGCPPPPGFTSTGLRDVHIKPNFAGDSIRIQFKYISQRPQPAPTSEDLVFKGRKVD